jgi:hypothetical protein
VITNIAGYSLDAVRPRDEYNDDDMDITEIYTVGTDTITKTPIEEVDHDSR